MSDSLAGKTPRPAAERNVDIEIRLLIEAIYLTYSYDFRDYSGASVKRRILHALDRKSVV